jgi:hypothetical protein
MEKGMKYWPAHVKALRLENKIIKWGGLCV